MDTTLDLPTIFAQDNLNHETYEALKDVAFSGRESVNRFLELISELERRTASGEIPRARAALKLGMCYLLLGSIDKATTWLESAENSVDKHKYLGMAYRERRRHAESLEQFQKAAQLASDKLEYECQAAESLIMMGEFEKASAILDRTASAGENSAHWHYTKARGLESQGETEAALDAYERALAIDEQHAYTSFHLAYLYDLHGNEEKALELYSRATDFPYVHMHALMNLAVIYEDKGQYERAADCLKRVITVDPNNGRARLYLKDVMAAGDMVIDEDQMQDAERRNAVLDIPVTDFELSVRSRNCLKKMNIHTLGDLLRTTEMELLSYKNFGETSLKEIKAMLSQKGLVLGQLSHEKRASASSASLAMPAAPSKPINPEVHSKPVASLQLSVRSRKCLQSLGITTLGDLANRTEAELMSARNFGQTSLDEIKKCLSEYGLGLRTL